MGHVFIVPGDIRKLACDAWLLPCDERLYVSRSWGHGDARVRDVMASLSSRPHRPRDWGRDGTRVLKAAHGHASSNEPDIWAVNVGLREDDTRWIHEGVVQFLRALRDDLRGRIPHNGRERHLVAIPVVGTGYGGSAERRAEQLHSLLTVLYRVVPARVDVAIVTWDWAMFSAAQSQRRRLDVEAWAEIEELEPAVQELARQARSGNLVLFVGAGVSAGAGLPGWRQLLIDLASTKEADFSEDDLDALRRRSPLDQARLIQLRLRLNHTELGERIAALFEGSRYSVSHAMLAGLPVDQVVTTNYDTLFELAARSAKRPVRVLPYESASDNPRWLLKLHGDVDHPKDIVLTREDYLRFGEQRQALAGIVHALLMTKHMLFVGFSLDDDNFHRIADDVRKVVHPTVEATGDPFGTAIVPVRDPLLQELWGADLDCVGIGEMEEAGVFRKLEIFLDRLLCESSSSIGHLLDPAFEPLLSREDKKLAELLAPVAEASARIRRSPAWEGVERLLRSMGYDPER